MGGAMLFALRAAPFHGKKTHSPRQEGPRLFMRVIPISPTPPKTATWGRLGGNTPCETITPDPPLKSLPSFPAALAPRSTVFLLFKKGTP